VAIPFEPSLSGFLPLSLRASLSGALATRTRYTRPVPTRDDLLLDTMIVGLTTAEVRRVATRRKRFRVERLGSFGACRSCAGIFQVARRRGCGPAPCEGGEIGPMSAGVNLELVSV